MLKLLCKIILWQTFAQSAGACASDKPRPSVSHQREKTTTAQTANKQDKQNILVTCLPLQLRTTPLKHK